MEYKKQFLKIFESLARSHGRHRVFDDFVSLVSIELSQTARSTFGLEKDEQDEKCYMDIVKRYSPDEIRGPFVELFVATILGLEHEKGDWLGCIYEELELGNDALGQFFTPYHVSKLMGNMICGDKTMLQAEIDRKGFVTLTEPACGSGGMVLAFAESFREAGFDSATQLFAVAQDISSTAACMCHIQLSLYGIPAVVLNKNMFQAEIVWARYTPVYYWMDWPYKLSRQRTATNAGTSEVGPETTPTAVAKAKRTPAHSGNPAQRLLFGDVL